MGSIPYTTVWLVATVVFALLEAIIPGLVSIWFAIGALAAIIPAAFGASLTVQFTVFVLVSALSLLATRPLVRKFIKKNYIATNSDSLVGKECVVTEAIDNIQGTGAAIVSGKTWSAKTADSEMKLKKGTKCTVERIEGVKLIISPIKNIEVKG